MQEYIQGHYQDCNMNVTSLAQEFGISVPHVSRSFKTSVIMAYWSTFIK